MTEDLDYYLDLITRQHSQQPRFVAAVRTSLEPIIGAKAINTDLPNTFDVDSAVGVQLDQIGRWVGIRKRIRIASPQKVFFAFGTKDLGIGQGIWRGRQDSEIEFRPLPDEQFRTLIKARIANNYWDGTINGAYAVWEKVFGPQGYKIIIVDYSDMTMDVAMIGPEIDVVMLELFRGGYLNLKPSGVRVNFYMTSSLPNTPVFGFDYDTDSVAGFDKAAWAIIMLPSELKNE